MRKAKDMYDAGLNEVDFLVMPTTVTPANPYPAPDAPPLQQSNAAAGKLENTSPFNGTGHPALAVPIGFVSSKEDPELKLPASLQIVGKYWSEVEILKLAFAWESVQDWRLL